jgi:hypothetical protein
MHGQALPAGLQESDQLPEPVFTPSTKADVGATTRTSPSPGRRPRRQGAGRAQAATSPRALPPGAALAPRAGIIIADTKFELGWSTGELVCLRRGAHARLVRFWPADRVAARLHPAQRSTSSRCATTSTLDWDKTPPPPPAARRGRAATRPATSRPTSASPASFADWPGRLNATGRSRRPCGTSRSPAQPMRFGMRRRVPWRRWPMRFDVQVERSAARPGIADPQGSTIERSLPTLGFEGVRGVRVGKSIRFTSRRPTRPPPRPRSTTCAPGSSPTRSSRTRPSPSSRRPRGLMPPVGVVLFPARTASSTSSRPSGARRRGRGALARRRDDRRRRRRRGRARRVRPRRLPAPRRHRPLLPGHGRRRRLRRRRRPGRRHLQRLPGAHRGRPAAGRAAEERRPEVPVCAPSSCGSRPPTPCSPTAPSRVRCCASRSTTSRATTPATPRRSPSCGRGPHRAALRRQPQRVGRRHRRHLQRGRNVVGLMPHPERACHPLLGSPTACRCCGRCSTAAAAAPRLTARSVGPHQLSARPADAGPLQGGCLARPARATRRS